MAGYMSPGAAFTGGVQDYLMQQAALERQVRQDALHTQQVNEEMDNAREMIRLRRMQAELDSNEKERAETQKAVDALVPGDIPDAGLIAKARKHNIPLRTGILPSAPESIPGSMAGAGGIAAVPVGQEQTGLTPTRTGPMVFVGNRASIEAENERKRLTDLADEADASGDEDQKRVALFLRARAGTISADNLKGSTVPAGTFPKPTGPTTGHTRVLLNPTTGQYFLPGDLKTPISAKDIAPNAVVDRMAEPRDTTAHDLATANHLQTTKEHAYKEFNDETKPIEETVRRLNKITSNLNQGTPIADSVLAEQLITLTAGGQGSGVRMSQPMIDQVLHRSRSNWQNLELALNRWRSAPEGEREKQLFFTPEQKEGMRDLVRAMRVEANKANAKVANYRHQIDDAKDVDSVNRIRTAAHDDIFSEPDDTVIKTGGGGASVTQADIDAAKRRARGGQ